MKKINLLLLILYSSISLAQYNQEDGKKDLEAAVSAAKIGDQESLIYNLRLFSQRIDDFNVTPEKLSKQNLDLYSDALYIAAVKKVNIPQDLAKKTLGFLNYKIEEKPNNMFALATYYLLGDGVSTDLSTAIYWYEKSANKGNENAMLICSQIFSELKNWQKSIFWIEEALKKVEDKELKIQLMLTLAISYNRGLIGVRNDIDNIKKEIYWIESALDLGYDIESNVEETNNLAKLYEKIQDYTKSRFWFEKSAKNGDSTALFALANFFRHGFGVPVDMDVAKNYYEKGCKCKIEKMTKSNIKFQ